MLFNTGNASHYLCSFIFVVRVAWEGVMERVAKESVEWGQVGKDVIDWYAGLHIIKNWFQQDNS